MKSAVGVEVPEYGTEANMKLEPGIYLALFHGRKPGEQLDDWGSNGPVLGPLNYVHTTYGFHIKLEFASLEAHHRYFPDTDSQWANGKFRSWQWHCGPDAELFVCGEDKRKDHIDDCVEYGGIYYGDWTVFVIK